MAQDGDAETRALSLFEQSAAAYRDGRFADAAALLEEAYALHPEPILLYNLARALDAEGDLDGAVDAYERFVNENPEDTHVPLARRRIEVLGEQIRERDAHAETARAEPDPEPEPEPEPDVLPAPSAGPDLLGPGIGLGAGLAVAAVGAILIGVAVARYDQAFNEPVHLTAANLEREAITLRDAGVGVLVVGGVASAVFGVWLGVAASSGPSSDSPSSDSHVELQLGPGSLGLRGTF